MIDFTQVSQNLFVELNDLEQAENRKDVDCCSEGDNTDKKN